MQSSRLLSITYFLLEKEKMTAKELSEHFEVSVRTIYRDIETLNMAGIPIYTDYGRNGGIRILDNYVMDKSVLSENEQTEILIGLQSLSATDYPNANVILKKMASFFKKSDFNWIEVDFSRWGIDRIKEKELFELLKSAIVFKRRIQCEYFNSKGIKSIRQIKPLKLLYKNNSWYLYGFCMEKQDFRLFKITRISKAELLEETFVMEINNTVPLEFKAESFGFLIELTLCFSLKSAHRVYDAFDNTFICRQESGAYLVKIAMPENDWLYEFLMSFGADVKIIEPAYIKENLKKKFEDALESMT